MKELLCVLTVYAFIVLSVLHHWIFKTKTETKTEYENKSMIVRINWFKKKKEMKELLCVLTVYDFIVVSSLEQLIVLLVKYWKRRIMWQKKMYDFVNNLKKKERQ